MALITFSVVIFSISTEFCLGVTRLDAGTLTKLSNSVSSLSAGTAL
jgi:hypothetical protein